MRLSRYFLPVLKENPSEAQIVSHRLMLRAGMIKQQSAGIYSWLPLGLRVLNRIEQIVNEEQQRAGHIPLMMPTLQSADLWRESGRYDAYGDELLRVTDRHKRDMLYGPTNEEMITDIFRSHVSSYKDLPLTLYHIQWKFRDEIRPRFGVMRGREFLMKDGYSFHASFADLQREYANLYDTYSRIFTRLGLKFRAVAADTGSIGGTGSHEFHVLADSGEDALAYCPTSDYAANVELAEALAPGSPRQTPAATMEKVATPGKTRCEDVADFLGHPLTKMVKAIAVMRKTDAENSEFVLLLLRGDHDLNEIKAEKVIGEFRFAQDEEIVAALGCKPGYIGPVGANNIPVFCDRSVAALHDFTCGANEAGHHIRGVNFGRDLPEPTVADLRNVVAGDSSPDGKGTLELCRGIEVGHIFQLRTKYAEALKCCFLDEAGQSQVMEMGCYGIGVTRIVGAAIEQGHDERGIVFPTAIAPFEVCIVPMGYSKSEAVKHAADALYAELKATGVDVLLDDRNERPGVMFADMELIGIPHRIVVGDRGLAEGKLEYKGRRDAEAQLIARETAAGFIQEKLCTGPSSSSC